MIADVGLIVNLGARGVKRRYAREAFWRDVLPDARVWRTSTLSDLDAAVVACRQAGVRVIAALGGDGTQHHLVDAVLRHYSEAEAPALLALAGGTLNGVAHALGNHGDPARVLRSSVMKLVGGAHDVVSKHVLRVTDVKDGSSRYGFGFAAGLPCRIAERYYRAPDPGMWDAIRVMILQPLGDALTGGHLFDDIELDVNANGEGWSQGPQHTVAASVFDNPLLWLRPFDAPLGDGPVFHFGATALRPRELAPRLWSIYRGRCRHPRLRIEQCRAVTIRGTAGYLIDGDLYETPGGLDLAITAGAQLCFLCAHDRSSRSPTYY